MEALLLAVMGITNLFCFIIGARVGQRVTRGDPVEVPTVNPMKAVREAQARKEYDKQQEQLNVMLQNVDNYDGTGHGQKDVPGRW